MSNDIRNIRSIYKICEVRAIIPLRFFIWNIYK